MGANLMTEEQTGPLMMSRRDLIRTLGLAFLPIIIYIVVEAVATQFYGEAIGIKAGLIVALAIGVISCLVVWIREKRIDRFIILDTGLLLALGGISLISSDPLFFKLKPGLIEVILLVMVGATAFTPNTLLIDMSGRYLKGVTFDDHQIALMRRSMRFLFAILFCHVVLIFVSAIFMDHKTWAFISGPLFYLVLFALPGAQFLKTRFSHHRKAEFLVDLLDDDGMVVGKAPLSHRSKQPDAAHAVLLLILRRGKDTVMLDRRLVPTEDGPVEMFSSPVIAIPPAGTNHGEILRELAAKKFPGLTVDCELIGAMTFKRDKHKERLELYVGQSGERVLRASEPEVVESKFTTLKELKRLLGEGKLDPYTGLAFKALLEPKGKRAG